MLTRFIAARRRAVAFRKLRDTCLAFQKAETAAAQLPALRAKLDRLTTAYIELRRSER